MNNKFAWASMSENGTVNGRPGDQTGKEVKVGYYYDFGQRYVIRCKSKIHRRRIAKIAKFLADQDFLGYGQNDRTGFYNFCVKNKWNWSKISEIIKRGELPLFNIDCSELAGVCINLAYRQQLIPSSVYTGSLLQCTVNTYPKRFKKISVEEMLKKPYKGDMPVNPGHHVIINI